MFHALPVSLSLNLDIWIFPGERLFALSEIQQIIATKAPPFETEENLKEAFSIFDKDGNGYVDVKEIRHVLVHLGEKLKDDQVDEMLRDVEISGDNQFNFEGNVYTCNLCTKITLLRFS